MGCVKVLMLMKNCFFCSYLVSTTLEAILCVNRVDIYALEVY